MVIGFVELAIVIVLVGALGLFGRYVHRRAVEEEELRERRETRERQRWLERLAEESDGRDNDWR